MELASWHGKSLSPHARRLTTCDYACLCVTNSGVWALRDLCRKRYSLKRQLLLERMMRRWDNSGSSGRPSAEMNSLSICPMSSGL